jgi:hypothetical protein
MDKNDFFDRLIRSLQNIKDKYELESVHDALILWFGENYLYYDPLYIKERIVIDSHAEGIDTILVDRRNRRLLFIQAETVESFDNVDRAFSEVKLKSTLEGVRFLLKGDYKGKITPDLENLADEYHDLDRTCDYKTEVIFLLLKKPPVDTKFIECFSEEFKGIKVCFYDFDWLFKFYIDHYLNMRAEPPERISFEISGGYLQKDSPNKSILFSCKGRDLARVYADYKERIFERNVRYSLGQKSKSINKKILETASSSKKSKEFWYFNNGVTIICKKIDQSASKKVISLDYAQIINGAQTTYALYGAYKDGLLQEDVEIIIKAIESSDKNFVDDVTLYTNSQNPIRLRDLSSNDDIQREIQKVLLDSYLYFYERKRGEIDSLYPTPESKKGLLGNDYKVKLVDNENAAQAFLALYLNKPAQAKSELGRIFIKDDTGFYDEIFRDDDSILAEKILLSWKLLRYIEGYKKSYKKDYRKAEGLKGEEKNRIYRYDFLLHSEYFILNLFKDFIQNDKYDLYSRKDDLLAIISKIDSNDEVIIKYYSEITDCLASYVSILKEQAGYYHNKFFKNENSIGLVRNYFKEKYKFVEIL